MIDNYKGNKRTQELMFNHVGFGDQSITEGKTSELMSRLMIKCKWFSHYTDEDWEDFGRWVKKRGVTKSVFTGILPSYLIYLSEGKRLPATTEYFKKYTIKIGQYAAEQSLRYLEEDDYVIEGSITIGELLSSGVFIDYDERKRLQDEPENLTYPVWFYGEMTKELLDYLRRHGTKIPRIKF